MHLKINGEKGVGSASYREHYCHCGLIPYSRSY